MPTMEPVVEGPHPTEPFESPTTFEGFDIAIEDHHRAHIDRLVDHYEAGILTHLDEDYARTTTKADRLADGIAAFGGSWRFILLFSCLLSAWILWNTVPLTRAMRFDPAPFILLNLCLSFIAAFQAPVIMMSQNRQAARDKRESIIDFAINYKAEQDVDDMQAHLHRMEAKLTHLERLLHKLVDDRAKT
jgi:uncharacterized membrane protein